VTMRAFFRSRVLAAAGTLCLLASTATAQAWDPIAFGPLGAGLPNGQYFSSVIDISGDGLTFVGGTNLGQGILRTPGQDYTLTITGGLSPFAISRNGQTVSGGVTGQTPRRWDLSNASGNTIASTAVFVPPGTFPSGPAYNVNHNGTHFAMPTPTMVLTPSALHVASQFFLSQGGSAGAYRGLASNAPVMIVLGNMPGNNTNAYRWNYQAGTLAPLNMPAGATGVDAGGVGGSLSADGLRTGGSATIGGVSQPYWWDEQGTPHAVTRLAGSVFGSLNAMNYTGTLGGGSMFLSGQGNRAFLYELNTGVVYNLDQIYRAAGLLPTGWTLIATRHISDDGSRVFCTATAPDGSTRAILLEGSYIPAPGTLGLAALAGLVATRRRRR